MTVYVYDRDSKQQATVHLTHYILLTFLPLFIWYIYKQVRRQKLQVLSENSLP